jgi:2-polyprenyl-6-hydroxyphenyl methylase / 3-demethylubiquinone-9 3-methyltransferase
MSNVDAEEIQKFEKLAARWWDPHGEFKPLHDINPLRLNFINERTPLAGKRVVDVGCGGGILAEAMSALGARVTGIDKGEAPLAVARLHLKESGRSVSYHNALAEEWAEAHTGEYDVVTCLELLEHVPDPSSTVAACAKLVAPGGAVFFSTINRNPKAWLFAIVGAEYILGMLPKGTHDYAKLIKPSELAAWCRHAGLDVREMTGMHYSPLTQSYRLAPGLDVNYLAYTRLVND